MTDTSIHANALDTILRQRFIWIATVPWWALTLALIACAYLWLLLPSKLATLSVGTFVVALLLTAPALFTVSSVFFDPLQGVAGILTTFALVRFGRIWQRERKLRAYAPTHLVEESQTNGAIEEGQEVQAAILFADIKSFTALAESKDPHTVYQLVRECIQILVDETHKAGGMIDKFTGDGVMAVFGLTEPRPNDAHKAVLAALNMQAALERLNQGYQTRW